MHVFLVYALIEDVLNGARINVKFKTNHYFIYPQL